MTAITFDTLKFVEQLTAAGVPEAHAKAEASAFREILSEAIDTTVATKADIMRLENSTKADIARVENKIELIRKDMQALEMSLTIKLGAFMAAAVGIIVAVMRLPHL